jgi:pyrrolidone-carboxylate peptidase
MTKTALITGSETFGNYATSPSKWLALSANGKVIAGHRIHTLILPSIIRLPEDAEDHGVTIVRKAQSIGASVILSFGLSSEVTGFRLERSATNWISSKYAFAYESDHPVDAQHQAGEQIHLDFSRWDFDKMRSSFQEADIPLEPGISDDPGQYACNAWIYRTYNALKQSGLNLCYLFVHMSCTEEAIETIPDFPRHSKMIIPKEMTLKALELFLKCYE